MFEQHFCLYLVFYNSRVHQQLDDSSQFVYECIHERTRQGRHKPSNRFRWNLASLKVSAQNYFTLGLRKFSRNRGELTTPLVFFKKMTKKHLKIGQKYKALLLKEFHQTFSYFQWMLSYPKTIYCNCFVLLRQVPMTQVISAKTPPLTQ